MYYFVSDIHLGAGDEARARRTEESFVSWLDAAAADARTIYILGDLFDFWFEYRHVVPRGFVRTLAKLAELTSRGIRIVFLTGNHDMWVRDYLARECGIEVRVRPVVEELCGRRVMLAHGDNMNIGRRYGLRLMNGMFRSRVLRFLFSWLLHPDLAMSFGHWWSGKSRKSHSAVDSDGKCTEQLIDYARKYAAGDGSVTTFIFGHMHSPRDYSSNGLRVVLLGHWQGDAAPAYAVMDDTGSITLKTYGR